MASQKVHRKDYNYGYNTGYAHGQAAALAEVEQNQDDQLAYGLAELALLLTENTGYLRVGVSPDGVFWARYKWSKGALAGRYTFGSDRSLGGALTQVYEHARQCEVGERKASLDSPARR